MSKKKIIYQPPGAFEEHRFEKLHNVIFDSSLSGSRAVADEIATLIRQKQDEATATREQKNSNFMASGTSGARA